MLRYLHVSDNAHLDVGDKMSKVRPLLSHMNEKFLTYFRAVQTQNLSIDESMVPYYGRHSCKQFIRGKPIRFGYKVWMLSTSLGYMVKFEPYQGAKGRQAVYPCLGMGGSVVIDLIAALQEEEGRSYHLTFDNLFTSLKLVGVLTEKNIACRGTIRANRLGDCPVCEVTEMKKTTRGSYDHATDTTSGLTVVRWNDNNIVNVVSNKVGVHPLQTAKRWSRIESKQVTIPQPFMIRYYSSTMGGVDRTDQNIVKYRTVIQCKEWWWPLFSYCLDLSVQQAWHLYRSTNAAKDNPLDLLAIRRGIVRVYLARARPVAPGRPRGFVCPLTSVSHQRSGMTVLIISCRAGQHSWDVEHVAKRRSVVVPNAKLAYTTSASSCTMLRDTPESFTCTVSNMTVTFECWNHTRQLHSRQLEREHGQCYLLIIVTCLGLFSVFCW